MDKPSVRITSTSGCAPLAALLQALHEPQPLSEQTNAWAKATAALDRPLPGGPVNTHAWVMLWVSVAATAFLIISTTCS